MTASPGAGAAASVTASPGAGAAASVTASPAAVAAPVAAGPTPSAELAPPPSWWRRPGLDVLDGRLSVNGADLEALARAHGTPLFVYDLARPRETVRELQAALARSGVAYRTRFALKACPDPRILAVLRSLGAPGTPQSVGIDACSPGDGFGGPGCQLDPAAWY